MSKSTFTRRLQVSAIALALTCALGACSSTKSVETPAQGNTVTTNQAFSALNMSQNEYATLVQNADINSRFPALILWTRAAIVAKDFQSASQGLASLQKEAITPLQRDQAQIIEGLLLLNQGKTTDSLFALNKVNELQLPAAVSSFYYQVISNVELTLYKESHNIDHLLKAVDHKIKLLNYVNEESKQNVALQVVKDLQLLPASELTVQLNKQTETVLKGFIDYAIIDSSGSAKLKQQLIANWSNKYKGHILDFAANKLANKQNANTIGNVNVDLSQVVSLKEGDNVAVLLPLTGRFAAAVGEPARLGILAALQDRNSKLKVTFYDTNRMTMAEISSAIGQNGTNFIIGPILKPEVDALQATDIKLPTIVFNKPATPRENMYYFNLGPDYEGALAASKIYRDGKYRPLVIAPESTRGQRVLAGFNQTWQQSNSRMAVSCRFGDINNAVAALTTCPLNNADAIYVNATAAEVIKLRPLFPDNTTLYLTDRSYMGINHSSGEVALAGAQLGDMPWLLTDSELKRDLMATLPEADSQVQRIFAAAYDSINLSFNLETLARDKSDVLHGISGDLQLGQEGLIEMAPMWVTLGAQRQTQ